MPKHVRATRPTRHSLTYRRRLQRRAALAGLLLVATLGLAGCGSYAKVVEPYNDAPRGAEHAEKADIIVMPDGFSNLATKCGPDGMRYTVAFHSDSPFAAISVVPDDKCPK